MRRGDIDGFKAMKIHEPTVILTGEQARQVDAVIATRLNGKDPAGLRGSTNLAMADPEAHAERCYARRAQRKVELIPIDVMTWLGLDDQPAEMAGHRVVYPVPGMVGAQDRPRGQQHGTTVAHRTGNGTTRFGRRQRLSADQGSRAADPRAGSRM